MRLNLEGDVALVSASSSGLGKASAKALAREGADVVINGRDESRLMAARDEIRSEAEGRVVAKQGDLTEPEEIKALVDTALTEFDGLDHLVSSAGGPPSDTFADTTDRDWYEAFDLLIMSVVRLVRQAEPHLREDEGGTIVNIESRTVKEASDTLVLSNAVRMGVIGLEKTLSRELAPKVRANAVLPALSRLLECETSSKSRSSEGNISTSQGVFG